MNKPCFVLSLNGTFFTEDKLKHHKNNGDGKCVFLWKRRLAKHTDIGNAITFQEFRRQLTQQQIDEVQNMAPIISHHGWMPEPPMIRIFPASFVPLSQIQHILLKCQQAFQSICGCLQMEVAKHQHLMKENGQHGEWF